MESNKLRECPADNCRWLRLDVLMFVPMLLWILVRIAINPFIVFYKLINESSAETPHRVSTTIRLLLHSSNQMLDSYVGKLDNLESIIRGERLNIGTDAKLSELEAKILANELELNEFLALLKLQNRQIELIEDPELYLFAKDFADLQGKYDAAKNRIQIIRKRYAVSTKQQRRTSYNIDLRTIIRSKIKMIFYHLNIEDHQLTRV